MATTSVTRRITAPADVVYRALLDPAAVQRWMVPDGMTSEVHAFDAREGGGFHVTLTYDDPDRSGKTEGASDSFHGRFSRLEPGRLVEQVVEFDTDDPAVRGEMTLTYELTEIDGATVVVGTHRNLPPGVRADDNEVGWNMSLAKLAALVEG